MHDPMNCNADQRTYFASRAADFLSLAAAPSFAIMALLTFDRAAPDLLCSAAHNGPSLSGMTAMYMLMCAFHTAPWLKLIIRRRSAALSCPSVPGSMTT